MTQLTYNELLENYKLLIGLVMDLKAEKEAYMRVVQEELESGDDHETDYVRLQQAKEKWEQAADAQLEAHCGTYYHVHNQYTLSLNQSKSKNDNCDKVSNER